MEKQGIKETTEVLTALLDLSVELAKVFKDGVQVYDSATVLALFSNPVVQEKIKAAYEGVEKVDDELKDLDAMEVLSLVPMATLKVSELIQAIKK